ncbi:hypothetical protein GXW82_10120 [Streptacidiphilus sp. 4-A2]|nr:hypothetical protein [Streptacidiphilus sp. 4-A2]
MVTNGRPEHANADLLRGLFLNTVARVPLHRAAGSTTCARPSPPSAP